MKLFLLKILPAIVLLGGLIFAVPGSVSAQPADPPPAQSGTANQGNAQNAPAAPASSPRTAGQFPQNPFGFYRGNAPDKPAYGGYISLLKLFPIVAIFFLWIYTTRWADEDGRSLKLNFLNWNALLFLCGVATFLAVLQIPNILLGYLVLLLGIGAPLGCYIYERNGRVPESGKVMTPAHIQKWSQRMLGRLGISFKTKEGHDTSLGPPIRFIGKSISGRGEDESRSKQAEKSKGYLAAKELVYDAIMRRATDIHLEPKMDETAVRYRIDGVMYPAEPFERSVGDSINNIFKVLSAMDITEKRRSQDGSFRAQLENRMIDFRVASQGTREGEKLSVRILDQSNSVSQMAQLGLRKQMLDQLREVINQPNGLLLTCGPTGAGKSTTLYACLNELDAFQQNIITVEDPIEYKMPNVTQIEINTKAGQNFAGSLRSILRQDPDVVMIGEIRDEETAKIACQAANTGHMVFSTVHANDTISALFRLFDLGVEPFLLSSSLSAIMGQRLVRKLCPDCREAYKPTADSLKQAGLPADKIEAFYRAPKNREEPCLTCGGLGYKGRIGVYELFIVTERIKDMIREKAPVSNIRAEARKNGMLYMKEEGLRLVVKGITSVQELTANVK